MLCARLRRQAEQQPGARSLSAAELTEVDARARGCVYYAGAAQLLQCRSLVVSLIYLSHSLTRSVLVDNRSGSDGGVDVNVDRGRAVSGEPEASSVAFFDLFKKAVMRPQTALQHDETSDKSQT